MWVVGDRRGTSENAEGREFLTCQQFSKFSDVLCGTPNERSVSVVDARRSLEVGGGWGRDQNSSERTKYGGDLASALPTFPKRPHTVYVPFLLRCGSVSVLWRSLTILYAALLRSQRFSTDRVEILYSPVKGY